MLANDVGFYQDTPQDFQDIGLCNVQDWRKFSAGISDVCKLVVLLTSCKGFRQVVPRMFPNLTTQN